MSRVCEHPECFASIAHKRPQARFCSDRCRARANKRGTHANNAQHVRAYRQRKRAERLDIEKVVLDYARQTLKRYVAPYELDRAELREVLAAFKDGGLAIADVIKLSPETAYREDAAHPKRTVPLREELDVLGQAALVPILSDVQWCHTNLAAGVPWRDKPTGRESQGGLGHVRHRKVPKQTHARVSRGDVTKWIEADFGTEDEPIAHHQALRGCAWDPY